MYVRRAIDKGMNISKLPRIQLNLALAQFKRELRDPLKIVRRNALRYIRHIKFELLSRDKEPVSQRLQKIQENNECMGIEDDRMNDELQKAVSLLLMLQV